MGIGLIFLQVTVLFGRLFIVVIGEPIVSLGCRLIYRGSGKLVAGSACVLRSVWWHKFCQSTAAVIISWPFSVFLCIDYCRGDFRYP